MKIAFIDIAASYHAASPLTEAMGGTQAAVCYLAAELFNKGCAPVLFNQNRVRGSHYGVQSFPPEMLDDAAMLAQFDALVINGRWTKKLVDTLRKRCRTKIVGWMHEASFNDPWILPLPEFDGLVFVSEWQHKTNAPLLPQAAKIAVIPNGIAPGFHTLFKDESSILGQKTIPPIMAYAGGSKRGLLHLPDILPGIHEAFPEMHFEIYSDCNVDNDDAAQRALRERLLNIPGMTHVGAVAQQQLPQRMKQVSYFISPNPYPETFCICLAEAMAAGAMPVITARAALPATAAGFGAQVPIDRADSVNFEKDALDTRRFTQECIAAVEKQMTLRQVDRELEIRRQVDYANAHYAWPGHAERWLQFLGGL